MACNAMKQKRNVKLKQDFGNRKSMNPSICAFGKKMLSIAGVTAFDSMYKD